MDTTLAAGYTVTFLAMPWEYKMGFIRNFFKRTALYNEVNSSQNSGLPEPKVTPPMPEVVAPKVKKPRKTKAKQTAVTPDAERRATEKAAATAAGEPWVDVIQVLLDPSNVGNGSFELDFNEIFVARLVKAGYKGKTDYQIVEQWFTDVCRNVVLETFEQAAADPSNPEHISNRGPVIRRDLGDGRTEVS